MGKKKRRIFFFSLQCKSKLTVIWLMKKCCFQDPRKKHGFLYSHVLWPLCSPLQWLQTFSMSCMTLHYKAPKSPSHLQAAPKSFQFSPAVSKLLPWGAQLIPRARRLVILCLQLPCYSTSTVLDMLAGPEIMLVATWDFITCCIAGLAVCLNWLNCIKKTWTLPMCPWAGDC